MPDPNQADTVEIHLPGGPPSREPPAPFSSLVQVDLAALSDVGKVRANNEDHYLVVRFGRSLETLQTNLPEEGESCFRETGYGLAVADGIGGEAGGEEASRLALRTIVNLALHAPDWILRPEEEFLDEVMRRTEERYRQANNALNERARAEPELGGMGTTMTLALSLGAALLVAHIGDSRAYLFRKGELRRLTRDHTLAQAQADLGQITPQEAARSRLRHVLTRSLGGGGREVHPEVQRLELADGDCFLICSDGLTDMVDEGTIAAVLGSGLQADPTCRRLVDCALERGGKDNVTVVVARYRIPSVG
jgi:serine/threonine protein phosphatase PrpC